MLVPVWQAPDGGDLGAGAGTSATWIAPSAGTYKIILVVSDGDRRFGQEISVVVNESDEPEPSPLETFAPDTETPAPTPTATPTPAGDDRVEVGVVAEGNDDGGTFSNDEEVTPGSTVTYLITFDNDFGVPVTITNFEDFFHGPVTCFSEGGGDIIGLVIPPDDGDAPAGLDVLDGGADEVQCLYDVPAPAEPNADGAPYVITVRGTVEDPVSGQSGFGDDDVRIFVVVQE
ncbi:MAG: hypothetical protein GTO30_14010 [Acidobacteria bacterium]|nr:hypothetical protein [Acidobacteriota bacterium]